MRPSTCPLASITCQRPDSAAYCAVAIKLDIPEAPLEEVRRDRGRGGTVPTTVNPNHTSISGHCQAYCWRTVKRNANTADNHFVGDVAAEPGPNRIPGTRAGRLAEIVIG